MNPPPEHAATAAHPSVAPSTPPAESSGPSGLRSTLQGGTDEVRLPRRLPIVRERRTQSNIPNERARRDALRSIAAAVVKERGIVPPAPLADLRQLAVEVVARAGFDPVFVDYAAVLVNNEVWRDELAHVPFERRLLLLPKCLRVEAHCPAPFDQFGMLCKECGLCSIEDFAREAEALGYAVLIAEGSAIVTAMVETGKIDAIVGVSCLNVLEKCFPHMERVAIPGMSIPLLQDDCIDTNVDVDQVRDLIHLTASDRTYRLDLEGLKVDVRGWFTPESLAEVFGPTRGVDPRTDALAREWLGRDGKRWRPFLATAIWLALESEGRAERPAFTADVRKLAVAIECFHKASLIHDDIEDGDDVRYGEPTLHAEHGVAVAINVGDLLLGEGYRLLSELDAPGDVRARLMAVAAQGHTTLARGQGAELEWARAPKPLASLEVLGIFREKTAPAFEVALRQGALLAGASQDVLDVLGPYSEALGIAYQIHDDLDDFTGAGDSDDLADLRPSLILAIAHKRASEGAEQDLISAIWRKERAVGAPGSASRLELEALLGEWGVVQKARDLADAYEVAAVDALAPLSHPSVKGLLRRVVGKIFGEGNLIEGYCSEFEARNAAGRAAGAAGPR
ncbi:MAG: polyprenyl synthetase family protein [Planctomycetota bacterium]